VQTMHQLLCEQKEGFLFDNSDLQASASQYMGIRRLVCAIQSPLIVTVFPFQLYVKTKVSSMIPLCPCKYPE
jgi:hypothetical protein